MKCQNRLRAATAIFAVFLAGTLLHCAPEVQAQSDAKNAVRAEAEKMSRARQILDRTAVLVKESDGSWEKVKAEYTKLGRQFGFLGLSSSQVKKLNQEYAGRAEALKAIYSRLVAFMPPPLPGDEDTPFDGIPEQFPPGDSVKESDRKCFTWSAVFFIFECQSNFFLGPNPSLLPWSCNEKIGKHACLGLDCKKDTDCTRRGFRCSKMIGQRWECVRECQSDRECSPQECRKPFGARFRRCI